ncbi:hypothetical protein EDB84DRAFT_1681951 [Lactarius hengduanensis]|nr:hypothetical protein EDB84DRAFT_1681951 [Lactarius hengduanensis]
MALVDFVVLTLKQVLKHSRRRHASIRRRAAASRRLDAATPTPCRALGLRHRHGIVNATTATPPPQHGVLTLRHRPRRALVLRHRRGALTLRHRHATTPTRRIDAAPCTRRLALRHDTAPSRHDTDTAPGTATDTTPIRRRSETAPDAATPTRRPGAATPTGAVTLRQRHGAIEEIYGIILVVESILAKTGLKTAVDRLSKRPVKPVHRPQPNRHRPVLHGPVGFFGWAEKSWTVAVPVLPKLDQANLFDDGRFTETIFALILTSGDSASGSIGVLPLTCSRLEITYDGRSRVTVSCNFKLWTSTKIFSPAKVVSAGVGASSCATYERDDRYNWEHNDQSSEHLRDCDKGDEAGSSQLIYDQKIPQKLVGRKDIEEALRKLDRLTQEEARMAAAQILNLTHGVDNK